MFGENPNPIISVILPVFRANSRLLIEALDSIAGQTYANFECLCIYDSPDDISTSILSEYEKKDDRFKVIYGNNTGLVSALNLGLRRSFGKYIARMDADDISLAHRFERQILALEEQKADICGSHFIVINKLGKSITSKITPLSYDSFVMYLGSTVPFAHGSVMFRSDLIKKNSIEYSDIKSAEDYDLWARLFESGAIFTNVDEFLFKYRDTQDSLSKRTANQTALDSLRIRNSFIKKNKAVVIQSLEKQLLGYDMLSYDEKKFILIASFIATRQIKSNIFFRVLMRSQKVFIFLFILNLLRGI